MNKNNFNHSNQLLIFFHHLIIIYGIFQFGFNFYIVLAILFGTVIYNTLINGEILHIKLAHGKYKDNWPNRIFTVFLLLSGGVSSPLAFAYIHRLHHKHVDTDLDPHSPRHLGKLKVWFLFWQVGNINPNTIRDFITCPFQVWIHRNWLKLQLSILLIFWFINPLIVICVISPIVVMSMHYGGFLNVNGHWNGTVRNIPEIIFTQPLSWRHADHHKKYDSR